MLTETESWMCITPPASSTLSTTPKLILMSKNEIVTLAAFAYVLKKLRPFRPCYTQFLRLGRPGKSLGSHAPHATTKTLALIRSPSAVFTESNVARSEGGWTAAVI
jgi:hypothetical protein